MSGFDWNAPSTPRPLHRVHLHDETLRDGVQSPSLVDPPLAVKRAFIRALARAGVHSACLALPAAGPRALDDAIALLRTVADERLPIVPVFAARTLAPDIDAVIRVAEAVGHPVEVTAFLGASPIRQWVEGWTPAWLEATARTAVRHARRAGLTVSFVLEDTSRTAPEMLERLIAAAVAEGATRIVLCDTAGHATPEGARRLVTYVRGLVPTGIGLDWHGHDDRGLAVGCAVAAAEAGCDRVHGCVLGVGERVGNADLRVVARALAARDLNDARPEAHRDLEALVRPWFDRATSAVLRPRRAA